MARDPDTALYCSFCGKSQHEVRKLIAGPTVFICDECVELCNGIIRDGAMEVRVREIIEQYLAAHPSPPKLPQSFWRRVFSKGIAA